MSTWSRDVVAFRLVLGIASTVFLLSGCAQPSRSIPRGALPYDVVGVNPTPTVREPRIQPADRIDVRVLFEPDLTREQVRVGADGAIQLPLVGQVKAGGLTAQELAQLLRSRLRAYIKEPQVEVSVASTISDRVTVEGNVNDPGAFDIAGSSTLLEILARAKSPNRTASLKEVVVFRNVDGQRMAAVFDVGRIRRGIDKNPTLYPGDIVVVGFSNIKGAFRDVLGVVPALIAVFRPF